MDELSMCSFLSIVLIAQNRFILAFVSRCSGRPRQELLTYIPGFVERPDWEFADTPVPTGNCFALLQTQWIEILKPTNGHVSNVTSMNCHLEILFPLRNDEMEERTL